MRKQEKSEHPIKVCYPLIGNHIGGSHISTLMLAKNLDRARFQPVVVLHEEGALTEYLRRQGLDYELIAIPKFLKPPYWSLRNLATLVLQTGRLVAFLRRQRVGIVHGNDLRIHFGWTFAARIAGAKWIWHQRTTSFGKSRIKLLFARLSHQVICISRHTASTIPNSLAAITRVVANPFETGFAEIDRTEAAQAISGKLALAPDTTIIGFFGNFGDQKRPAIFLRAAAKIRDRHATPLAFLLFGAERNNARSELSELAAELGLGDSVHFMGFQSPVERWMAGCDLIISPGLDEGLGRTLVEAMIVGTPVVAADSGGHRDVITDGENGMLATVDDPEDFAARASSILSDSALAARLVEQARTGAIRDYSIKHHVTQMMEIYMESLGSIHRSSLRNNKDLA